MKRIVVTGVGGNVGQYLAQYLHKKGYHVIGLYRNNKPKKCSYELMRVDLSEEELDIDNIDVVIHAAAAITGSTDQLVRDNVLAVSNLIDFAERKKVRQFIYLSSVSVYGETYGELTLDSKIINPQTYGMTKYIAEKLVKESKLSERIVIGLPRMLGPFVNLENINGSGFLIMTKKILQNEDLTCFIPQTRYNNFMHVEDLAIFINKIMNNRYDGYRKVLLGVRERLCMYNILQIMKNVVRSRSQIKIGEEERMPQCALVSIEDAVEMGYKPMSATETITKFMMEINNEYYYN